MNENQNERALGWDDEIEKESEFTVLKPGEYDYTVESFERGRHNGSENLPPCNIAILKIRVHSNEGDAVITHRLFLHSKTEGFLSAFFTSIGQKKQGEKLKMNWNEVPRATGRCKIGIKEYNGNQYNEIKSFLPKAQKTFTPGQF